jgi:hypothetical protein
MRNSFSFRWPRLLNVSPRAGASVEPLNLEVIREPATPLCSHGVSRKATLLAVQLQSHARSVING